MRVAWFQDVDFFVHMGGAEQTDREIVKYGIRRGHEIDLITPENLHEPKCDLAVFSNCHVLMYNFGNYLLEIVQKVPYVCFHHDYPCKYRLFYPMKEKCKQCVYLPLWRRLYNGSIVNIFMSPLHRDGYFFLMPELANYPHILVPSAINMTDYQLKENPKPNSVIGVNCLFSFKGKENVLKYTQEHPELSFTFVGGADSNVPLPHNCRYIGPKSREELVKLYAENEYLIHLPNSPSPFDRIIPEYLIANPKGKLIVNHLVGALSWSNIVQNGKVNRERLIELVTNSAKVFWDEVEVAFHREPFPKLLKIGDN